MIKILVTSLILMIGLHSPIVEATDINALNPIQSLKVKSKYFKEAIEYNVTLPKSYNEVKGKDKKYFILFDLHPR
ncbi:MAG: hypothetical protein MJK12_21125, partial [Colwellia sp.]|nr:hypothetical protein [Colwellia sp.]